MNIFHSIFTKVSGLQLRLADRNFLTLIKMLEIKLLGKYASTYCYNFPSHILIELTARCNLRCPWCQQCDPDFRAANKDDMPLESALKILPGLKGAQVLLLYNIGEPLLYPHLFEVIREAKKYIPQVRITTNGVLLTKEIARKIKDAGLTQLNVSIDSPDSDIFNKIRKTDLIRIEENVIQFCEITGIPVNIWSVISSSTIDSLEQLPEYSQRFKTCTQLYFQLVRGFELNEEAGIPIKPLQEQFERFKEIIIQKCRKFGLRTNLEYIGYYPDGFFEKKVKGICNALMTTLIAVNNKGFINPCCTYRNQNLDNVFEMGFKRAWNGPKVKKWRKMMLEQKYPVFCSNWCGYRTLT